MLMKEVWVGVDTPFKFSEKIDPKTGIKTLILTGLMLPFDVISRNNVLYNKESVVEKHKSLIGRPVMYNHKVDGEMLPKGHFVDSYVTEEGWMYKADIDPEEKDLIRKLERGDLRHVSIQLIGGKVEEKVNDENRTYTEAWVSDIIEGSIVPAPGFLDTTASFAEALGHKPQRFAETGFIPSDEMVIAESIISELGESDSSKLMEGVAVDKGFTEEDADPEQLKMGIEVETEHTDDPEIAKRVALDHLAEIPDYYTRLKKMEDEAKGTGKECVKKEWKMFDEVEVIETGERGRIVDEYEDEDIKVFMVQTADDKKEKYTAEKLRLIEDITTTTGDGAIAKSKLPNDKEKEIAHPTELTISQPGEGTMEIENILADKESVNLLKEFVYLLGDVITVPYGISGVPISKYVGQIGMITKVDEKSYEILFQDGKKVKVDRKTIDVV